MVIISIDESRHAKLQVRLSEILETEFATLHVKCLTHAASVGKSYGNF